jgi:transposase
MLHVDHYLQIRLLHRDGLSIRQIAKKLGHSRDTVKKALVQPTPLPYTRTLPAACPKLGPFIGQIEQILTEDQTEPRKQRHTAARIFQRLREEFQYLGGYDQVRRFVAARRKRERETHLLLDHPPGGRLECDYGHIYVDFPEGRRLVPVLLAVWSYSHYAFAIALPDETTASILHGTVCALEFFGCVPTELWWDNPRTVAPAILRGRDRQINIHYASLASHYRFAPMFCMPARGQEKSDVERTVYALERRFATPVPQVSDMDALNRHLLSCCQNERSRTVSGRSKTIGEMFEEERTHAASLPDHPFDACVQHIRQADKYQTVLFEDVRYSVPRHVAFEPVTVKAYVDQILLVHKGQVVAKHRRSRTAGDQVLEPTHFLATLERKPAYLDHTKLFKELKLPAAFGQLRDRLEKELGPRTGTRHYIRVLQLLGRHTAEQVARAIEANLYRPSLRAEFIEQKLAAMASHNALPAVVEPARPELVEGACPEHIEGAEEAACESIKVDRDESIHTNKEAMNEANTAMPPRPTLSVTKLLPIKLPTVIVPPPDLRRFDQLLIHRSKPQAGGEASQGEGNVQSQRPPFRGDVAQAQSEDPASADDAGGVCPALS